MKTMGLHKLILVDPIAKPDDHSLALSCNARDVVENIRIAATLDEIISSSELVIAMTGRKREFSDRLITPKAVIPEIMSSIANNAQVSIVLVTNNMD